MQGQRKSKIILAAALVTVGSIAEFALGEISAPTKTKGNRWPHWRLST